MRNQFNKKMKEKVSDWNEGVGTMFYNGYGWVFLMDGSDKEVVSEVQKVCGELGIKLFLE